MRPMMYANLQITQAVFVCIERSYQGKGRVSRRIDIEVILSTVSPTCKGTGSGRKATCLTGLLEKPGSQVVVLITCDEGAYGTRIVSGLQDTRGNAIVGHIMIVDYMNFLFG